MQKRLSHKAQGPYAVGGLTPAMPSSVPLRDQHLHFNAMQLPDTISENGYTATLSYHGDKSRACMTVTGSDGYQFTCDYYDHQYNEFSKTVGNVTLHKSVLWLGGTPLQCPRCTAQRLRPGQLAGGACAARQPT